MRPFNYERVVATPDALATLDGARFRTGSGGKLRHGGMSTAAHFIAGGTTLLDLMKLDVVQPNKLVDISRMPMTEIKETDDGVLIGALVTNSDLASNPIIKARYSILSQALLAGASQQLRNKATVGGNILQRSRCPYFRDPSMDCNKRNPGSGCPAIKGFSRMHAIVGVSDKCISAHPSDMCVALAALGARIHLQSTAGSRVVAINEFFLTPENHPEIENVMRSDEIITGVQLPASRFNPENSHYLKVRDRESFSFAIVSVAACLEIDGTSIKGARVALGGVATKPWFISESDSLIGKTVDSEIFRDFAEAALKTAQAQKHNKFKIELTKRSIVRALEKAAGVI